MPDVTRIVLLLLSLSFPILFWVYSIRWVRKQGQERELSAQSQQFWNGLSYFLGPLAAFLFLIFVSNRNELRWGAVENRSDLTARTAYNGNTSPLALVPSTTTQVESNYYLRIRESVSQPKRKEYTLVVGKNMIGRALQPQQSNINMLTFDWDGMISGKHLQIDVQSDETVYLSDLGSTHGTKLNGQQIEIGKLYQMNRQDLIVLGRTTMELEGTTAGTPNRTIRVEIDKTQVEPNVEPVYTRISLPHALKLTVVRGPDVGKMFHLEGKKWIVGRSKDASWKLEDEQSSRKHLEIRRDDNVIWVRDLESKRGTLLNKRKVTGKFIIFKVGDTLRVGRNHIRLERNNE